MSRMSFATTAGILLAGMILIAADLLPAQQPRTLGSRRADTKDAEPEAEPVEIIREALRLIDPKEYQISLQLEPIRRVQLASTAAGIVGSIEVVTGETVPSQKEAIRLDDKEHKLLTDKAAAEHRAAQIELKRAGKQNDPDLIELAQAKLDAAKAQLDLTILRSRQTRLRAPFAGTVLRVFAVDGEMIRAGQPLMDIGDLSKLKVEIPIGRTKAQKGARIEIMVEDKMVTGTIEEVLPLHKRFEPLRSLVNSIASATVVFDNSKGEFNAGQTVYSPLIPRYVIAEVPTGAIGNLEDGNRKIQVIRNYLVRDIQVQALAQLGSRRIYVSGPFVAGDEVVVSASEDLADGTQVRPRHLPAVTTEGSRRLGGTSGSRTGSNSSGSRKGEKNVDF